MKRIVPIIIGIIYRNNTFLLTFRHGNNEEKWANNHWQFPGGGIEFGETPEKALIREMKEETGLDVSIRYLVPRIISRKRSEWQGILISYVCDYLHGQKIILNSEASTYGWYTAAEIRKLRTLPGTYELAQAVKKT